MSRRTAATRAAARRGRRPAEPRGGVWPGGAEQSLGEGQHRVLQGGQAGGQVRVDVPDDLRDQFLDLGATWPGAHLLGQRGQGLRELATAPGDPGVAAASRLSMDETRSYWSSSRSSSRSKRVSSALTRPSVLASLASLLASLLSMPVSRPSTAASWVLTVDIPADTPSRVAGPASRWAWGAICSATRATISGSAPARSRSSATTRSTPASRRWISSSAADVARSLAAWPAVLRARKLAHPVGGAARCAEPFRCVHSGRCGAVPLSLAARAGWRAAAGGCCPAGPWCSSVPAVMECLTL